MWKNDYLRRMQNNRLIQLLLICLLVMATSCRGQQKAERPPIPVILGDVVQADIPILIETFGNVLSPLDVQIRPQVGGIVTEAYVKQGQLVKKGDPLFKIDPRPFQAALDKARATLLKDEAALELAEITLKRNADLVKKDYISKLTYEQYKTNVESARAQVLSDKADIALAELNLEWATPTSPITGKISEYNLDPGNLVVANDAVYLTNIRQIDPIDVQFNVPQRGFVRLQHAEKENALTFYAILPQRVENPREGKIYFIDNHIDTTTGTLLVKGRLENADGFLWPGEYVRIQLLLKVEPGALLVPEEAVHIGQEGPFVYVYDASTSTAIYRPVTKGEHYKGKILLEKGVSAGEKVVVKGMVNLRPGAKVSITDGKS